MQQPDSFVILEIIVPEQDPVYRLFSCWYGGYLDSDSWRLNSGIVSVEEDDDWNGEGNVYLIAGNSGTVYQIHEDQYNKLSSYCLDTLHQMLFSLPVTQGYSYNIINIKEYLEKTND